MYFGCPTANTFWQTVLLTHQILSVPWQWQLLKVRPLMDYSKFQQARQQQNIEPAASL